MAELRATILTVGDELLIGQVVNSNSAWIGQELTRRGVDVRRMITVADDEGEIRRFLRLALEDSQIVLLTGGLGPTHDDITKQAVAREFDADISFREDIMEHIRQRFSSRKRELTRSNLSQAMVPDGFHAEPNEHGTAPGLIRTWTEDEREMLVALMPGVPHEMRALMQSVVFPRVAKLASGAVIRQKTLLTTGMSESNLNDALDGLEELLGGGLSIAFLPNYSGVRIRLTARAENEKKAGTMIEKAENWIRRRIDKLIYGSDDDTLEGVVGRELRDKNLTIGVAESCTGGLLGSRLTDIPGSSHYVMGGAVTYSDSAKIRVLSVDEEVLAAYGAVSEETALQMAKGIRELMDTDLGLATTGIMGPGGGTAEKPVGTLWIALARRDREGGGVRTQTRLVQLGSDRKRNKQMAATRALDMVREALADGLP